MMSKIFALILLFGSFGHAQTYIKGPALVEGRTSTVTSVGTTVLTVSSQTNQIFTGVNNHIVELPAATTLPLNRYFQIINRSNGRLTVHTNGGVTLTSVFPNSQKQVLVTDVTTAAGTWDVTNINVADVTGVLPIAHGGTNNSSVLTAGSVLFSDGTRVHQDNANFFFDDTNKILRVNSKLGVGNSNPLQAIEVSAVSDPALRLSEGSSTTSYLDIADKSANNANISKTAASGTSAIYLNPITTDGTSASYIELFRDVNTTGNKRVEFFKGDGTSNVEHQVRVGNFSYWDSSGSYGTVFGAGSINASAQLQVDSTAKGFLQPRMTTTQKNAVSSPATGLQVFDTTLARPYYYSGSNWVPGTQIAPNVQVISTTGACTYNTPAGAKFLRVRMVGAGGGGGGSGTADGTTGGTGGDTVFGTRTAGGGGGTVRLTPGNSGSNSGSGYTVIVNLAGQDGAGGNIGPTTANGTQLAGGVGGSSFFGAGGTSAGGSSGSNGRAFGSGGGGGGNDNVNAERSGGGGGSGGYYEFIVDNPASSISCSVGAGGAAGGAGTSGRAGGVASSGVIVVEAIF